MPPSDDAARASTQALADDAEATAYEVKPIVPDLKLTIPDRPFDPPARDRPPVRDPELPPGWDAVPNGCNDQSDLGCQGFSRLGEGCDLVADGICRAYSPSAFSDDRGQYRWTCRCEKVDF